LTWPIYPICIPCNHFIFIFNSVVKYIKIIINMGGRVIVFKPGPVAGPVQGSCSRFWSGHPVARVNPYFLKNQNDVILVKKNKSQRVATGFLTGFCRVTGSHWVMTFPIFSATRPGSSPRSARSRVDLPGRAEFQNDGQSTMILYIQLNGVRKSLFPHTQMHCGLQQ
jgi:hypothetical protein